MKKLLTLGLVLFLTGCVVAEIAPRKQASCEKQFSKFEDVFLCTKESFEKDPMAMEGPNSKLFFLKGAQLVEKLKKGEITEIDARAEWQKTLVDIKYGQKR